MPDLPDERQPTPGELRGLRALRVLVTLLTVTMIAGIVALVALLYTRLPGGATAPAPPAPPALPEAIALPEGAAAQAVTAGPGWWAVVTRSGEVLFYDAEGALLRRIEAGELAAP
jgi:hypothetical protein